MELRAGAFGRQRSPARAASRIAIREIGADSLAVASHIRLQLIVID
jgi:hypothetical protein